MKKGLVGLGLCVALIGLTPRCEAAEGAPFFGTPRADAVLNNPASVTGTVAGTVNAVAPTVEEIFDLHHSEWHTASSLALFTLPTSPVPVASLRAGWVVGDAIPFGEVQIDAPQLLQQIVIPILPASLKTTLTSGILQSVDTALSKYAHVGGVLGWNFESNDGGKAKGILVGVSLGARLTF